MFSMDFSRNECDIVSVSWAWITRDVDHLLRAMFTNRTGVARARLMSSRPTQTKHDSKRSLHGTVDMMTGFREVRIGVWGYLRSSTTNSLCAVHLQRRAMSTRFCIIRRCVGNRITGERDETQSHQPDPVRLSLTQTSSSSVKLRPNCNPEE